MEEEVRDGDMGDDDRRARGWRLSLTRRGARSREKERRRWPWCSRRGFSRREVRSRGHARRGGDGVEGGCEECVWAYDLEQKVHVPRASGQWPQRRKAVGGGRWARAWAWAPFAAAPRPADKSPPCLRLTLLPILQHHLFPSNPRRFFCLSLTLPPLPIRPSLLPRGRIP